MRSFLDKLGVFFFRHRNWVFPVLVAGFFAIAMPPSTIFGSEALESIKDVVAILVAVSGLVLRGLVIGHDHVRRSGDGRSIHAAKLFTGGMFSLCRNPLYTGNVLIFLGIFLMHGNIVTLLLGSLSYIFIYYVIIQAEETYLRGTFGQTYVDYCARVPRWIPNVTRIPSTMSGLSFSFKRVLLVEYPNIGITVIALALTEFYEEIGESVLGGQHWYLGLLLGIAALGVVWVLGMRFVKKRRLITV